LYCEKQNPQVKDIMMTLKSGNITLSNGPALDFHIFDNKDQCYFMGMQTSEADKGKVNIVSGREFGPIKEILVYQGNIKRQKEIVYFNQTFSDVNYSLNLTFNINDKQFSGYYRVEVQTEGTNGLHVAFSNPIWHDSSEYGGEN